MNSFFRICMSSLHRNRVRSKSMCIDSCITLNSSDISCGEYASHTLTGRQASSMAKTTAIALCPWFAFLGRFPGRVSLLHTPWKDYGQKVTEVYRKTSSKHRFWIPLGNKTGKIRSRCFPARKQAGTNQNASRCAIPAGGSQNVLRYAIPISTSQGRFCHRWCSQLKKPLVGIFARGDVL